MGFISVAFKSISFHPHYSSLVLNASLKAGIYSVAMFHKNNHTVRCGYFYGYRERFYMLRRNKVALRQGFGLRPKHLHGAKAPRARRPLQRNAVSFSYAYAKKQALRCRGKPAFCIDWVPHTANRASCECSPSREGTPCSDFGRTHLNAPTRSEEPEHFRPQFLLVSPLPAGMGWHPAVHCYRTRTIFFAIPGNFLL